MREDLTEQEEIYAQWRASGLSKTKAAQKAYPDTKYPNQMGYEAEKRQCVADRILELKHERAESAGLNIDEQLRRYNEIYQILFGQGKYTQAAKILERIDSLGGFDAPSKSISMNVKQGDALKSSGKVEDDIKRFNRILGKHTDGTSGTEETPKESSGESIH